MSKKKCAFSVSPSSQFAITEEKKSIAASSSYLFLFYQHLKTTYKKLKVFGFIVSLTQCAFFWTQHCSTKFLASNSLCGRKYLSQLRVFLALIKISWPSFASGKSLWKTQASWNTYSCSDLGLEGEKSTKFYEWCIQERFWKRAKNEAQNYHILEQFQMRIKRECFKLLVFSASFLQIGQVHNILTVHQLVPQFSAVLCCKRVSESEPYKK